MFFFKKNRTSLLIKRDEFYRTVTSKLPIKNRIQYCESLIYRNQCDLSRTKCPIQKRKIKQLLKAAKTEVKNLK